MRGLGRPQVFNRRRPAVGVHPLEGRLRDDLLGSAVFYTATNATWGPICNALIPLRFSLRQALDGLPP